MPSPSTTQKTIWIWSRGIYPGQMPFYFKAKALPRSVLNSPNNPDGDLTIVPIAVNSTFTGVAPVYPDTEAQPADSKLPVLKVTDGDKTHIIHQSTAVVEYLEACYPISQGYRDLSGSSSPELHAKIRGFSQLVTDATIWFQCDVFHRHPLPIQLGLITAPEQSAAASAYAQKRWKTELAKLDRWVQALDQKEEPISLIGALDYPTIADCAFMGVVELFKDFFDVNVIEGFRALETWHDRYTESPWWVPRDSVDALGANRFAEFFTG